MKKQIINHEQKSRHCGFDPQSPCFLQGIPASAGMTALIETSAPLSLRGFSGSERSRITGLPRRSYLTARNDAVPFLSYALRHCEERSNPENHSSDKGTSPPERGEQPTLERWQIRKAFKPSQFTPFGGDRGGYAAVLLSFILFLTTTTSFSQNKNVKMRLDSIVSKTSKYIYVYDDKGNNTLQISYTWRNNIWAEHTKCEYTYNVNGNQIMCIFYNWTNNTWVENRKYEYTYNANGNRIIYNVHYTWKDNAWKKKYKSEYTYDANGNQTMWIDYFWENNMWVKVSKHKSTYDANENQTIRIDYFWENNIWVKDTKFKNTYDTNKNEILRIYYCWKNGIRVKSSKHESTYDTLGNQTINIYYTRKNNSWIEISKDECIYDIFYSKTDLIFPYGLGIKNQWIVMNNKLTEVRTYNWMANNWECINITKYYYSPQIIESNNKINTKNE